MKYFVTLLCFVFLYSFDVEFTKVFTKYIIPNKNAIKIITKKKGLKFPFQYIKTKSGYILYGNFDKINLWLDNDFYAPEDAKFTTVKIAYIDFDKIQLSVIKQIKNTYKKCSIKKIIFLNPNQNKIITKPMNIELKYKIILNCK